MYESRKNIIEPILVYNVPIDDKILGKKGKLRMKASKKVAPDNCVQLYQTHSPEHLSHWGFHIALALCMLVLFSAPAVALNLYDFSGTVLKVSEPNSLTVDVSESRIAGLGGVTEVLIDQPLPDLSYFQGKNIQFSILGHDILGRPVATGYLNGMRIQDVYYCIKYPRLCAYYGPYFRNELIGTEAYNPHTDYETHYYFHEWRGSQTLSGQY